MYDMYGVRITVYGLAPSSPVKDLRTKLELYPQLFRVIGKPEQKITMACATVAMTVSFGLRYSPLCSCRGQAPLQQAQFNRANSLRLSSSHTISGFGSLLPLRLCTISSSPLRLRSLTIVAHKGYKMKTHKVFISHSLYWVLMGLCALFCLLAEKALKLKNGNGYIIFWVGLTLLYLGWIKWSLCFIGHSYGKWYWIWFSCT